MTTKKQPTKRRKVPKRKEFGNLFDKLMHQQGKYNSDAAKVVHKTSPTISRYRLRSKPFSVPGPFEAAALAKFVGFTGNVDTLFKPRKK